MEAKDLFKGMFQGMFESAIKMTAKNSEDEKPKKDETENEDVDKRKTINEVAGMMKSGGCDDELIRTAIAKIEKIAYDKSEAGTSDNEDDEDDKTKKEAKNKKSKNEDEDDEEEETEELEQEEEIANKGCKNKAKNSMDKIRKAILSGKSIEPQTTYLTKEQRLELGNNF